MKAMIGLLRPSAGTIHFGESDYWQATDEERMEIGRRFGACP